MLKTETDQLWLHILEIIKPELKDETFDLWFKPLSIIRKENGGYALKVPNRFFTDWIKTHYEARIEELLSQAAETPVRLEYELQAGDMKNDLPDIKFPRIDAPAPLARAPKAESTAKLETTVDNRYEFDSFVVGPTNRFAEAAAKAVARDPGRTYNPLFIYGGVGLGKTHLLHAIGNEILKVNPTSKVTYLSCERFINEYINAIRFDGMKDFRARYRNVDCFLVDDIQFLMGKEASQEEFFFTFNSLYDSRKQIVICSDRPPRETKVGNRLISRFEWGVITDIQPPSLETRIAILRKKIGDDTLRVPDDVVLFLASHIKTNIRELEGSVTRVLAYHNITGEPLTVDLARKILHDVLGTSNRETNITIDQVQRVVAQHFNLDLRDMKSKRRTDAIAFPRQVAMYLSRTLTEHSTTEIGLSFGGKDHTTIMHACNKIKAKLSRDPYFVALLNKITQDIREESLLETP